MANIKKTIIVLPYDSLATKEIVVKLSKQFPHLFNLFDDTQIHFTPLIDENLSFIFEGDTVIIKDDTEYTITSVMAICEKTKNPVIVLKDNEFVEVFLSRKK